MNLEINTLDLFSGIGGFTLGLQKSGFIIKKHYFSEVDKHAIANYKHNFKDAEYVGSVTDVRGSQLPRINVITGGSPCQDMSLAGKRAGLAGQRSSLVWQQVRIITECRPDFFIWENVKGAFSSNDGADFWAVIQAFANIGGYRLEWQLLNGSWFLPQNRERIYLVGHLAVPGRDYKGVFPFTEGNSEFNEGHGSATNIRTISAGGHSGGHHSNMTLIKENEQKSSRWQNKKAGNIESDIASTVRASGKGGVRNIDHITINEDQREEKTTMISDSGLHRQMQERDIAPPMRANTGAGHGNYVKTEVVCVEQRGRNPENPSDRTTGAPTEQRLEENSQGITNTITGVQKDNLIQITTQEIPKPEDLINIENPYVNGYPKHWVKLPDEEDNDYWERRFRMDEEYKKLGFESPKGLWPAKQQVLSSKRTEFGKSVRKQYEAGEAQFERKEIQKLEPRTDGVSNTITGVQKDNLIQVTEPPTNRMNLVNDKSASQDERVYGVDGIAPTIVSSNGTIPKIEIVGNLKGEKGHNVNNIYSDKGIAPTVRENHGKITPIQITDNLYPNRTRNYTEAAPTIKANSGKLVVEEQTEAMKVANTVTPDAYLTKGERNRDESGNAVLTSMCDQRIRRLTEIEVERLQGFPDGWTEYGNYEVKTWNNREQWAKDKSIEKTFDITYETKKVPKTQRYKMCGNAVMVDCVEGIGKRLMKNYVLKEVL